jgi:chemotaxis protein CheD
MDSDFEDLQDAPSAPLPPPGERRHNEDDIAYFDSLVEARPLDIPIGRSRCSNLDGVMLVTTVGSGIGICMHDPEIEAGGLGHLLLPDFLLQEFPNFTENTALARHHCETLMGTMMTTLVQLGARPANIRVKLFGGGDIIAEPYDAGRKTYIFAKEFLVRSGLQIISEDIGQKMARRIQFVPVSGKGMRRLLKRQSDIVLAKEAERSYVEKTYINKP